MSTWLREPNPIQSPAPELDLTGTPVGAGGPREAFVGQVSELQTHVDEDLIRRGRCLVGAAPEWTPDMRAHVEAFARAQGDAVRARAWNTREFGSDARLAEILEEKRAELLAVRAAYEAQLVRTDEAGRALSAVPAGDTTMAAPAFFLAGLVGLGSGGLLIPSVRLIFGGAVADTLGADLVLPLSLGLSMLLGQVAPVAAVVTGVGGARPWKFAAFAASEVACFALFAYGRAALLSGVDAGAALQANELAVLDAHGHALTVMFLALEVLGVCLVNGIGMQLSEAVRTAAEHARLECWLARERDRLAHALGRVLGVEAWMEAHHQTLQARDAAAARGENERQLVETLVWQGVLEQTQANWDALHGATAAG